MYKLLDVVIWSISQSFVSVKRRECCFEVFSVEKSICLSNKRGCKGWVANFSNLRGKSCLFLLHGSSLNASQTNSTGLDTAILLTLRDCSSDFDLDFVIFSGSKLEKNTKDGSPDLPTVSVWDRKGGKGSKFTVGNISKILFWADRSNFCRSIYRFQPATVQSPEAESLYRRENNQGFQLWL